MKKIIILILLLIPIKINALSASSYIVMDYDSGRVLEGSNTNTRKLIASTTKIMTCIVALENANPEDIKAKYENGVLTINVSKVTPVDTKKLIAIE